MKIIRVEKGLEDEIYFCDRLFWVSFYSLIYLDKYVHFITHNVLFNVKIRTYIMWCASPLWLGSDMRDNVVRCQLAALLRSTNETIHSKL